MILHSDMQTSPESDCPYLPGKKWRTNYFFASQLTADELDILLARGWRKFGMYYFRPVCRGCDECIPIRLRTAELNYTKSMKRVSRRCGGVTVRFNDLEYSDDIYEIYRKHSEVKFGKVSGQSDFLHSFYTQSCPAIQSEYYLGDRLIAAGFLDVSSKAMSSIYFVYDPEFSDYRLGTFSVLKETAYAASLGLDYYYLGYYIRDNGSMAYKNSFHVNEKMDWSSGTWFREDEFVHSSL